MKKTILLRLLLFVFAVASVLSCNDIEQTTLNSNSEWKVSSDVATRIAKIYRSSGIKALHKTDPFAICSIDSFVDINDITAMYVVNFCNDSGWVIISADLRMEPIMAHNNEGNFGHGVIPAGLAIWMEGSVQLIEEIREHNVSHPTAFIAWMSFFEEWDLDDIPSIVKKQEEWDDWGSGGGTHPCHGVVTQTYQKGELLDATWGQLCTYNDLVPSCTTRACQRMPVGCVATATGQIMKYWGHPQADFDFTAMPSHNGNSHVANLLEDIGNEVSMNYDCTGSGAQSEEAKKCLDNVYGYDNPKFDPYNLGTVISDIQANKPVYLDGCHTQTTRGWWIFKWTVNEDCHAWVCDGYRYSYKNCTTGQQVFAKEVHMNWGWHEVDINPPHLQAGSDWNGWFKLDDWRPGNGWNFQFGKDMIHNIDL